MKRFLKGIIDLLMWGECVIIAAFLDYLFEAHGVFVLLYLLVTLITWIVKWFRQVQKEIDSTRKK